MIESNRIEAVAAPQGSESERVSVHIDVSSASPDENSLTVSIPVHNAAALVKHASEVSSGIWEGKICSEGTAVGSNGVKANSIHAKIYRLTDTIPDESSPQGVSITPGSTSWSFSGSNLVPEARCKSDGKACDNDNRLAVWAVFPSGKNCQRIVPFKGLNVGMTDCEGPGLAICPS